jgi:uncharacterized membrane protein
VKSVESVAFLLFFLGDLHRYQCKIMPVTSHANAATTVLILGSIIGLAMLVITPPFQVPDEDAHFFRAYQAATFDLGLEHRNGCVGAELPRALLDTKQLFEGVILDASRKVDASMYTRALSVTGRDPVFCSPILPYPPVPYVAQAVGLILGNSLDAPPIVSFYFARILNLALFLFLATWAIRWMPVMRWGLALLVLMPMTMYQAGSLSADAFTIGISFLMIAFILRSAAGDEPLSAAEIAFLFAGAALLALAKQGYSPLVLLAFMIPSDRFGTRTRKAWILSGLFMATVAIGIGCTIAIHDYSIGPPGSDSAGQLRFILTHPLAYIATLFRSCFRASHFGSFIGWFGWLEIRLPLWIIIPYGLLLIAVSFVEHRASRFSRAQRFLTGAIFAFLVAIVFTVQYLQWTAVGKMSIDGVQGRYFIPFAPLLLLLFSNTRFCFSFDNHALARRMLVGFILLAHGVSAAMLLMRYYPLSL